MALFDKFAPLAAQYAKLEKAGSNPFNVTFDQVLSPTEARIGNRSILLRRSQIMHSNRSHLP